MQTDCQLIQRLMEDGYTLELAAEMANEMNRAGLTMNYQRCA